MGGGRGKASVNPQKEETEKSQLLSRRPTLKETTIIGKKSGGERAKKGPSTREVLFCGGPGDRDAGTLSDGPAGPGWGNIVLGGKKKGNRTLSKKKGGIKKRYLRRWKGGVKS